MISSRLFRSTIAITAVSPLTRIQLNTRSIPAYATRPITCSTKLYKEDKRTPSERFLDDEGDHSHAGSFSRTDNTVSIEYPGEDAEPTSLPVQGRGGMHFKRTLASFSLEGRVGIVTGGARGLGLVMSQALVISGCDVAIVDLNSQFPPPQSLLADILNNGVPEDEGDRQATELMEHFASENPGADPSKYVKDGEVQGAQPCSYAPRIPKVTAHYADVSNPDSVNNALEEIIRDHGKIDHLVTSAGFTENFDAIAYPYDRIKKLWGVNVDGTYLFATGVARHLMERKAKGSMVMIGSMSGAIVNVPQPQAPYNAAKAAVRHLASSLAVEWAHAGIRVNVISPGYMLTALTKKILDDNPDLYKHWTSLIPQGKMGQPEDLMGAVTYLLSDAAGYVTGADLRVDGGYTVT
ncbi:MAG: hypothetical protein LQ350_003596 [Teloschistes chrysophthalmus]|nr:MAG: hypothetical protein LQ350_003596 [Niorma chrysophthalma]